MANIYLNELDRFMVYKLKPMAYMRYGDDFLCFAQNLSQIEHIYAMATDFLERELFLEVNSKMESLKPVYKGISYLGVELWPSGRRLNKRMRRRLDARLDMLNFASYEALISAHERPKRHKDLNWRLLDILDE